MVTVKEQLAELPPASVAVQVTVVVPVLNLVPEAGEHLTVTPGQGSLATGRGNSTTVEHCVPSVFLTMLPGQVILGGCPSETVIVKVQLVELGPLIAVHVTVVTPTGKRVPDGGVHVTVLLPAQPPITLGGG